MNRTTTALLAALEALIVVAIGIGVSLVPLTVLWAVQYGLQIDWLVFWRASADVWLLGNGANLTVQLDPGLVATLALPGAEAPFPVTIAPLGFALLAVLLGVRTGRRAARSPYRLLAVLSAVIAYGALAALVTLSASAPGVHPSLWQGILLPTLVYAAGVVTGSETGQADLPTAEQDAASRAVRARLALLPQIVRSVLDVSLRAGTAAVAALLAVSAVVVAVVVMVHYTTMIGLYESLQAGIVGGASLTIAQLAFVPNAVIWAASWLTGPGFAVGAGSAVSPIGTDLGPVPGIPLLGALPTGELAWGFLGLVVPVLVGFGCAIVVRGRLLRGLSGMPSARWFAASALGIAIVSGVLLGLLAWWSSGAAGPGRLVEVGPNGWVVGLFDGLEIGIGALVGFFAGGRSRAEPPAPGQ
ncbi:DUF6350 family protein [Compostimonas suwonensis]|uniref:Uncharacterized protein n=1 Tax=Compostimonas suwonensis TaxID=1048394 RepID=A0A2M9BVA4_9MICO|nr:DUF6350 family protein [Compostimonas suwonensis]PJJ61883.1 hypothetical protein CLV54_1670 [Compostimonas suwonensis]